jgi:cold shock CspA family protein
MQQRRGMSYQWASDNPVLGAGEIGFEIDNSRFKIGDGVSTWSQLDYFSNEADVTTAISNAITNLVDGAPDLLNTLNEIAAAIGDDPDFFTNIATDLDGKVDVTGDTMTGDLTLANDPTSNLHAATKQYVDTAESDAITSANSYTDGRETAITSAYQSYADTAEADAISTAAADATSKANTAESNANTYTDGRETAITTAYEAYADTAESDAVTAANTNTDNLIGDATVDGTSGNTVTDRIASSESDANTYTDNLIGDATVDGTAGNTVIDRISTAVSNLIDGAPELLDTLNELAAAIGDDEDFITTISNSIAEKVAKAGDTMTGDLTLPNDPTENLHAATKQYVDTAESDAVTTSNTYTDNLVGDATVDGTAGNTISDRIATAVSDLVDGAPDLLNTLNELAEALGDDEDFITTITNSISEKVSKAGDTMTGDLTLAGDPTEALHAATKQYVDNLETLEPGGTTGQVLAKASDTDFDVEWVDISTDLGGLTDVDLYDIQDGDAIIYDAATGTFIPGAAGGKFTVSETPPADPDNGDTWFDSSTGKAYIYYSDVDSSQWVEIGNPNGYGSLSVLSDVDLTGLADGNSLVYDSASGNWIPGEGGGGGSGSFTIAETAPDPAEAGDIWFNSTTGKTYIYYSDYDNDQWVEIASTVSGFQTLNEVADVEIAAVADGDFLRYNSSTSKWENDDYTDVIKLNGQTISANYTVPVGYNGLSAGPITIADGVTVTVSDGSAWSIV